MVSVHPKARVLSILVSLVALAVFVAACGGGSSSSGSSGGETSEASGGTTSGSGGSSASYDAAPLEKIVQEHAKPGRIGPTVPIKGPIPADVTALFINCGAPACVSMEESFEEAAGVLGWTVETVNAEPTPASIQSAFSEAVRRKPDAVVTTGFAINQYPRQAKELNELEIPIISETGTDPSSYDPSKGVTLQVQRIQEVKEGTALMGDKAALDAGGEGEFGTVVLTGYPSVLANVEGFEEELERVCAECSIKQISIQPTSIGKDAPAIIANFLRANPGIKGIYFGYDALATGLPAAVKGAGLEMPMTYSWSPDEVGLQELQTGEQTAAVPNCYVEAGWTFADAIARLQTGGDVKDSQPWEPYVIYSSELNSVPEGTKNPPCIPAYKEEFEKLWGLH
jgi:ribose transport system substrate-binding protein